MKRLAITGGVATGKSTVAGYLRDLGYETVSADRCAREVFADEEVQAWLAQKLGAKPPVERSVVLKALTERADLRRELNAVTHPRIARSLLESTAPIAEVPLLVEACLHGHFERVWVVDCGFDEQLKRLLGRGLDEASAKALIATHLKNEVKCAFADRIVRTNQPEAHVQAIVAESICRDLA